MNKTKIQHSIILREEQKVKLHLLHDNDIRVRKQVAPLVGITVDTQLQAGNDCGNKACCDARGGTWKGVGSGGCEDHGTGDWD